MTRRYHIGLDVSKDATVICARSTDGVVERKCETATEPEAICAALADLHGSLERLVLGRLGGWRIDCTAR